MSASQIQKAGQAFAQIQKIRQRYRGQLRNVQDSTKRQQMRRKYQMATQKAIQSAGLSPMQFRQVMKAAKADPTVRKQFFSAIKQAGGQPPRPRRRPPSQGQQPAPAPSPGPGRGHGRGLRTRPPRFLGPDWAQMGPTGAARSLHVKAVIGRKRFFERLGRTRTQDG